ncbi:MAG: type II toxin-antitoxin system HicB family antitoxin [Verrucomicrobia subdivision 3 bacterium]|nr:type II toxin-antitoxin system HicB family antitoxin [Limisphaerales bacterium]
MIPPSKVFFSIEENYSLRILSLIMKIELEQEADGRWIAEVSELPGVMTYGASRDDAVARVQALALRVLADRLENGESVPELGEVFQVAA